MVPVKPLHAAKTRLRGVADHGVGDPDAHAALALALAHDTVAAVLGGAGPSGAAGDQLGPGGGGGAGGRRRRGGRRTCQAGSTPPSCTAPRSCARPIRAHRVGALQADLPALRPSELDEALHDAAALFASGARRAFCPDAQGTGTTLLLAAAGAPLDPRFGAGSAARHRASGAVPLDAAGPGLRRDVDTGDDLCAAAELGLGPHTRAVLAADRAVLTGSPQRRVPEHRGGGIGSERRCAVRGREGDEVAHVDAVPELTSTGPARRG